jgi:hypothetical protein
MICEYFSRQSAVRRPSQAAARMAWRKRLSRVGTWLSRSRIAFTWVSNASTAATIRRCSASGVLAIDKTGSSQFSHSGQLFLLYSFQELNWHQLSVPMLTTHSNAIARIKGTYVLVYCSINIENSNWKRVFKNAATYDNDHGASTIQIGGRVVQAFFSDEVYSV